MLRSATTDYAVGKVDLVSVLQATREVIAIRIELLTTELDQQRQLAAIERLIGGDL
jgi:outer membrane protein, heavy metal efflux system